MAGLFGGSAIGLIQAYCRQAKDFVDRNFRHLDKVPAGDLNFIYEQYLLYYVAAESGVGITPYLREVVDDPLYKELVRFQDIPAVPLIHPVGGFKRLQWVCDNLARCLREYYPVYYYRIIEVLRESGVPLRCVIYERMAGGVIQERGEAGQGFRRSNAAVAYLAAKYSGVDTLVADGVVSDDWPLTPMEQECLEEVRRLEQGKEALRIRLYGNDSSLAGLYRRDLEMQGAIRRLYGQSLAERMKCGIVVNPDAVSLPMRRIWVNDRSSKVADIVSRHFGCGEGCETADRAGATSPLREGMVPGGLVMLTPSVLDLSVQEYYLDELDAVVAENCGQPVLLSELLLIVRDFFDARELETGEAAYVRLIDDCVKRLLFAGVLILLTKNK